jgi:hypothetical protein
MGAVSAWVSRNKKKLTLLCFSRAPKILTPLRATHLVFRCGGQTHFEVVVGAVRGLEDGKVDTPFRLRLTKNGQVTQVRDFPGAMEAPQLLRRFDRECNNDFVLHSSSGDDFYSEEEASVFGVGVGFAPRDGVVLCSLPLFLCC